MESGHGLDKICDHINYHNIEIIWILEAMAHYAEKGLGRTLINRCMYLSLLDI